MQKLLIKKNTLIISGILLLFMVLFTPSTTRFGLCGAKWKGADCGSDYGVTKPTKGQEKAATTWTRCHRAAVEKVSDCEGIWEGARARRRMMNGFTSWRHRNSKYVTRVATAVIHGGATPDGRERRKLAGNHRSGQRGGPEKKPRLTLRTRTDGPINNTTTH